MRVKRSGTSDPVKRLMIEADINSLDKEKKLADAKHLKVAQKLDADSATYAGKNSINYEVQKLENIKYMNKITKILASGSTIVPSAPPRPRPIPRPRRKLPTVPPRS